jgi:hypothetical protein
LEIILRHLFWSAGESGCGDPHCEDSRNSERERGVNDGAGNTDGGSDGMAVVRRIRGVGEKERQGKTFRWQRVELMELAVGKCGRRAGEMMLP